MFLKLFFNLNDSDSVPGTGGYRALCMGDRGLHTAVFRAQEVRERCAVGTGGHRAVCSGNKGLHTAVLEGQEATERCVRGTGGPRALRSGHRRLRRSGPLRALGAGGATPAAAARGRSRPHPPLPARATVGGVPGGPRARRLHLPAGSAPQTAAGRS